MPQLCVLGCTPSEVPMHRFPKLDKFPEKFKAWVKIVGGNHDYEYYKTKRICDIHFIDKHRVRCNRLSAIAVPMLHLPAHLQSQVTSEEASTSAEDLPPTVSVPDKTGQFASQVILEQPSTSTQYQQHSSQVTLEQPSTSTHYPQHSSQVILEQPSTHYQQHPTSQSAIIGTSQNVPSKHCVAVIHKTWEHNYSFVGKPTPRRAPGNDIIIQLRKKVKHLQTEICRLRKKAQSFKTRLRKAQDVSTKTLFEHFAKNFNKPTQLFLNMQLQDAKKEKGRRFTNEEKLLALSLYQESPKFYCALKKLFTLPSTKVMKRLLSTLKMFPELNPIVFERIS